MHLEWGAEGLRESARLAGTVVVVDVLSFSTAVTVGVERGATVYPHTAADEYAAKMAERLGAHLAGSRRDHFSLSPASMATLAPGDRVVLPSPNGARLCSLAADTGATVVLGCLRNASALASWLRTRDGRVVVVAAGEQWRNGAFRVAVEDLLGAGAIFASLDSDWLSAEALVAAGAFQAARSRLATILAECTSGRELVARAFPQDPPWAADLDSSDAIPVLRSGAFRRL